MSGKSPYVMRTRADAHSGTGHSAQTSTAGRPASAATHKSVTLHRVPTSTASHLAVQTMDGAAEADPPTIRRSLEIIIRDCDPSTSRSAIGSRQRQTCDFPNSTPINVSLIISNESLLPLPLTIMRIKGPALGMCSAQHPIRRPRSTWHDECRRKQLRAYGLAMKLRAGCNG